MLFVALAVVLLVLTAAGYRRDPRMLRNAAALFGAVVSAAVGVLALIAQSDARAATAITLLVAVGVPLGVLVLGGALVVNGVVMLRREGRSLANRLSLVLGVAVLVVPPVVVALVATLHPLVVLAGGLTALVCAYLGACLAAFALWSRVLGRPGRADARTVAVVVHGCGLRGGDVTPLLRGRLDRAIEVLRTEEAAGNTPVVVPSGGRGDDETRAEATAMTEYLLERGVPADRVLPEDRSRTTRENLERSVALLRERGLSGRLTLVTSDYHVLRTASLSRRLGLEARVVGAPTARYYRPSAFLREFAAIMLAHRWTALALLVVFVVATAGLATAGVVDTLYHAGLVA